MHNPTRRNHRAVTLRFGVVALLGVVFISGMGCGDGGSQQQLPEWASFFASSDDLADFEQQVRDYFASRGEQMRVEDPWPGAMTAFAMV